MPSMLLIYPPVSKPCEPAAGIATLCALLRQHNLQCTTLDANLGGLLFLLQNHPQPQDTWSKRAAKNLTNHLNQLRSADIYHHPARYQRAIADLNRLLELSARAYGVKLSLGNYQDNQLSPLNSKDLLSAAHHPEKNIFHPYFQQVIQPLVARQQPTHIGISLNYLSQALTAFALLGFLRKHYPQIKLILGGGLITSWVHGPQWKKFNHHLGPFAEVTDHIIAGSAQSELLDLFGCEYKTQPFLPDFSTVDSLGYLAPGLILPYAAARGCYWNRCKFCPEPAEGNRYQPVPPPQALAELKELVATTRPKLVHLLDNAIAPMLLKKLAEQPLGVAWYGFARISEQLTDVEFCRALKVSGCVMLKLGIESGDQRVLDAMEKGVSVELTARVVETLHRAGIATYVYLLFGTPTENEAAAFRTMEFVLRHAHAITFLNLAIFNLPLGSSMARELVKHNFYTGDLSLYCNFDHPLGWDRAKVRNFIEHQFKRQAQIGEILRRDPTLFTSNHAPFTL